MTDYKNMTPEDEAKLVPDWATNPNGDTSRWMLVGREEFTGQMALEVSTVSGINTIRFHIVEWGASYARDLPGVIAFFAANGRLPRRLNPQGDI